jgi:glucose/arabinose dehydrogenase/mono/diheme cytochrome c family protein
MRQHFCFLLASILSLTLVAGETAPINPKLLTPGLIAHYQATAGGEVIRIDAKPAFTLGDSSPHPRLAPGPFNVIWSGVIVLRGDGPFSFDAFAGGDVEINIDGTQVLKGRGESETATVRSAEAFARPAGRYRIRIEFRSIEKVPARLQIWWQGAGFAREPLPVWALKHLPEEIPESGQKEKLIAKGRVAVAQLGCAQCHADSFPALRDQPPGPNLTGLDARVTRDWLLAYFSDPARMHAGSRMPALFTDDRDGAIERQLIADLLLKNAAPKTEPAGGDHRQGKKIFLSVGCVACHFAPDIKRDEQKDLERTAIEGLADVLPGAHLTEFLKDPALRFPDERHPQFALAPDAARDIAAYLLLWSKPFTAAAPAQPASAAELEQHTKRLSVGTPEAAAKILLRNKGCSSCHSGLGETQSQNIAITQGKPGCLSTTGAARYALDENTQQAISAYISIARQERHASPHENRRQLVDRLGCFRCHSTSDRPPPLEEASATLGGSHLETVPFLRTPRLNNALTKYSREYMASALRDGVSGVRFKSYSYRMPHFAKHAEDVVQAIAAMDGDLLNEPAPAKTVADPTLNGPGASLVGFEGYSCVSCHTWKGKQLNDGDPGAIGPDLTSIARRVRRDWFERWMDEPGRIVPGTVMPQIFTRGQPATIKSVLDGDAARQKEAIWAYLSLGSDAPSPKPLPATPIDSPASGSPPMVAQIPIRTPDNVNVESICIAYGTHDLLLYDVGAAKLRGIFTGAQILRMVRGRARTFSLAGTLLPQFTAANAADALNKRPQSIDFLGYERLQDGARIRLLAHVGEKTVDGSETFRLRDRNVSHEVQWTGLPAKTFSYALPALAQLPETKYPQLPDPGPVGGSLERPGYRAIAYPRPKTIIGEDLLMPGAVAVNPADGRVFVASMKNGELFVLRDPNGDGTGATFENYGGGLFQETYSMLAEKDALYVLHRRNLTRISENNGVATRFDRVFALPHGIAESYDYGYGLVRDKGGAFVMSFAPYANKKLAGSGSAIRVIPGEKPEEIAYGFRNPLGWCSGPDSEIFYTDNQGEWVATNKLCHIVKGRYYGYPNPEQREHASKPLGKTALWVPYAWARSINGVTYNAGDKFGPFQGQFFLAELMYGGAIVRAALEKVNGEYQGACFPFWGKGLLGPLTLAFDPKGRLFVGSITEPGWMAQPDRGGLFRIDFTGQTPFEIQSINVRPRGFRLNFTAPIDAQTAKAVASYSIEHYRYEYTGAYGSPELDRTPLPIEKIDVAPDGRSVELQTGALAKERVYMIGASGVKSANGESLVNPLGAYTLNEIPAPPQ